MALLLVHRDLRLADGGGLALAEGRRLADLGSLLHRDGQIALGDGYGGDTDIVSHDDDAGDLVDHHLGRCVGFDGELFDLGDEVDHVAAGRRAQGDDGRVLGRGRARVTGVDHLGDALGGGEVRIA